MLKKNIAHLTYFTLSSLTEVNTLSNLIHPSLTMSPLVHASHLSTLPLSSSSYYYCLCILVPIVSVRPPPTIRLLPPVAPVACLPSGRACR